MFGILSAKLAFIFLWCSMFIFPLSVSLQAFRAVAQTKQAGIVSYQHLQKDLLHKVPLKYSNPYLRLSLICLLLLCYFFLSFIVRPLNRFVRIVCSTECPIWYWIDALNWCSEKWSVLTHHTPNNSDKELLLKEKYRVSVFKSEREQEMKEEKRQQMITWCFLCWCVSR